MESKTQYMTPDMKRRYSTLVKESEEMTRLIAETLADLRIVHANISAIRAYGRASAVAFRRAPSLGESYELALEYLDGELHEKGKAVTELYRRFDEIEERKLDIVLESIDAKNKGK